SRPCLEQLVLRVLLLDADGHLRPQRRPVFGEVVEVQRDGRDDPLDDQLTPVELHPRRRLSLAARALRQDELLHHRRLLADGPRSARAVVLVRGVEHQVEGELGRRVPGELTLLPRVALPTLRVVGERETQRRRVELHRDRFPLLGALPVVAQLRERRLLESTHQSIASLRPSWAMCSSSIAISPLFALSCGPVTFAGSPRSNDQVASTSRRSALIIWIVPS